MVEINTKYERPALPQASPSFHNLLGCEFGRRHSASSPMCPHPTAATPLLTKDSTQIELYVKHFLLLINEKTD
jgi:hypothetical protein